MFVINTENFKKTKISYIFTKNVWFLSIAYRKCGHEYKKRYLKKKKNQLKY